MKTLPFLFSDIRFFMSGTGQDNERDYHGFICPPAFFVQSTIQNTDLQGKSVIYW